MVALAVRRHVRRTGGGQRAREHLSERLAAPGRRAPDEPPHGRDPGRRRCCSRTGAASPAPSPARPDRTHCAGGGRRPRDGRAPAVRPLLAFAILALSAVLAWLGVARPDIDVVQFVVRWGLREKELPPISIGASVLQFLLAIATIPAVKIFPLSVLYQPEIGPSAGALLATLGVSAALGGIAYCCGPAASNGGRRRSSNARQKSTVDECTKLALRRRSARRYGRAREGK